jgi:hypothetical protein
MQPRDSKDSPKTIVTHRENTFRSARLIISIIISLLIIVPCVWHAKIEAGDLASHVYNVWLTELIEKGQAPGLYIAPRTNNVLFDLALLYSAKVIGLGVAQKVVVGSFVLVFFWGVFALVRAVTGSPPWYLTPCIAMLAYGFSFEMGFMNYYVSIGLACLSLAMFSRGQGREWIGGVLLLPLVWMAHPIGFLWLAGVLAYVKIREKLPGWWKLVLPAAAGSGIFTVFWYTAYRAKFLVDWDRGPFYFYNGADQLGLFGKRYFILAGAAFLLGVICFVAEVYELSKDLPFWKAFAVPFELYFVTFCATSLLPENLRPSMYAGWIGLLGSRLTTISGILGICLLGFLRPRKWHLAGFGACALLFFVFFYLDTGWLNRLEANAEELTKNLQPGTRVVGTIWAPPGWRVSFVGHVLDRACIGHCFSYADYEPSTGEFRVRVRKGSPVVTATSDDAEDMASGEYEVDETDLPMKQVYQCDSSDLTKLCIRDLAEGEVNGRIGYRPTYK